MARELCRTKSSTGFRYSGISSGNPTIHQSQLVHQIQGYISNPEMVNLGTGIATIGFSKNLEPQGTESNSMAWRSFFAKPGSEAGSSSSKSMNVSTADFHQQDHYNKNDQFTAAGIVGANTENLIVGPVHDSATWQENRLYVDDSSIRCLLPCEGNERPSQGLSLSLSSANPSSIDVQTFELRHTNHHDIVSPYSRDHEEVYGKSGNGHQQHVLMQNEFVGKSDGNLYPGPFLFKNTKFLVPAQELLNEFCSLGTKQTDPLSAHKNKQLLEEEDASTVSTTKQSVNSLDFIELQRRKTKLLSMLEEVDRRYRHYCNQMKAVVSSFEAIAGDGAASVYSALASKAMSRHFRCLKDGILSQIKSTRKAMGEKDPIAPGTTKGETPRLRVIDQTLRQRRAFQQMSMMESHPWRPQRGLPERSVSLLRAWLFEHFLHPYPSDVDKHILARQTGLSRSQVSNWFINARVRLWKPMVEDMYLEETKEQDNNMASSDGLSTDVEDSCRPIQTPSSSRMDDQKQPPADTLVRVDSDCLSTIINNPDHNNECAGRSSKSGHVPIMDQLGHVGDTYGSMELDFTSYSQHSGGMVAFGNDNMNHSFNGGSVSLTLGLQQHGGSGASLAFPAASDQNSLFYPREHIEDCQHVQYSLLDAETQNLPYRNLMGAQLLHDLSGLSKVIDPRSS